MPIRVNFAGSTSVPDDVMRYKGNWNVLTNTPELADGVGEIGDVYVSTQEGTRDLGSGDITFEIGDWVVCNSNLEWEKSINATTSDVLDHIADTTIHFLEDDVMYQWQMFPTVTDDIYSIAGTELGTLVHLENATDMTLIVPEGGDGNLIADWQASFRQAGDGIITLSAGTANVNIETEEGMATTGKNSVFSLIYTGASGGTHNWLAVGINTMSDVSTHIDDTTIHFTEGNIDHDNITNVGTNSHSNIDDHIADTTIHFTEAETKTYLEGEAMTFTKPVVASNFKTENTSTVFGVDAAKDVNTTSFTNGAYFGDSAGASASGHNQVAVGRQAGYLASGDDSTFVGTRAGYGDEGETNIFIGYGAGEDNRGTFCIGMGKFALNGNTANNAMAIGDGMGNSNSEDNVFMIGNANVSTTPLIKGNFATGLVEVASLEVNGLHQNRVNFATKATSASFNVDKDIHVGKYTEVEYATDVTITIPVGEMEVGDMCTFEQAGAGRLIVDIAASGSQSINNKNKTFEQGDVIYTIRKENSGGLEVYHVIGGVE